MKNFLLQSILIVTLAMFGLSNVATAQTQTWNKQGFSIGQNATPSSANCNEAFMADVHRIGGQYIMYYSSKTDSGISAISYATSPDLLTWTVQDTILSGSADTNNREYVVGGPRLVKTNTGQYRLFYRCTQKHSGTQEPQYHIRSSISSNGISFVKEGVRIEIKAYQANSYFSHVGHSAFYVDQSGNFSALLTARDTTMAPGPDKIFQSVSFDQGLSWSNFTPLYADCHDPVVITDSLGLYHVYFTHLDEFETASSTNGVVWPATPDTLKMMDGPIQLTEGTLPQIADLGATVDTNGTIYLFSNYHTGSGLWTDIAYYTPLITSVSENYNNEHIAIYPNPTTGKFTIELQNPYQTMSLQIYNVLGEKVIQHKNINEIDIDLSNSPKGIYFVKVYDGTKIYTQKIVVQ